MSLTLPELPRAQARVPVLLETRYNQGESRQAVSCFRDL
jgi:hypothetical protein